MFSFFAILVFFLLAVRIGSCVITVDMEIEIESSRTSSYKVVQLHLEGTPPSFQTPLVLYFVNFIFIKRK